MRRRRDANHGEIMQALEAVGCVVLDLSGVGGGCPDLLVYRPNNRKWRLIEVKNPEGRNRVEKGQAEFHARWPVSVVRTIHDALEAVLA